MSYQGMTGGHDFEDIKERPSWLIPLILLGITLIFCAVIWWSYLGVSIDEIMGNKVSGTERGRILHVVIGNQALEIPENYTQFPKDRRDGARDKITLFTVLPDFAPYSTSRDNEFMSNAANSPVVHFEIANHPIALTESQRTSMYMDQVIDRSGTREHALTKYEFKDSTGFRDQDMYIFKTATGLDGMLRCLRKSELMPSPFCIRDTELGNGLSLRYRFKRAHLQHWNAIDRGILELVEHFVSDRSFSGSDRDVNLIR